MTSLARMDIFNGLLAFGGNFSRMSKRILKKMVFYSGVLKCYNRIKNRRNLTVVMFHRVIPLSDPRWDGCDQEWTISAHIFEQCIVFLKRYYHIISLNQLLNSYTHGSTLPPCPLLITFDDGWSDNAEFGFPILQKYNVPATIFLATRAIDNPLPFWQEHLYAAWKEKELSFDAVNEVCKKFSILRPESSEDEVRRLITDISRLAPHVKEKLLKKLIPILPKCYEPAMLSTDQIKFLISKGIAIGGHGASHEPLTQTEEPREELQESIQTIREIVDGFPIMDEGICFSFPHGQYNDNVVQLARESGYQLLFTSDPFLVPVPSGCLKCCLLGRVPMPLFAMTMNNHNSFSEYKLAFWLINRPAKGLVRYDC